MTASNILEWLMIGGGFTAFGTGISWFVFLPYKKKNESLKNEITTIQIWKDICNDLRKDNEAKDNKIEELYKDINMQRDEKSKLYKENEQNVIEKTRLEIKRCDIKGCGKRTPPSWW